MLFIYLLAIVIANDQVLEVKLSHKIPIGDPFTKGINLGKCQRHLLKWLLAWSRNKIDSNCFIYSFVSKPSKYHFETKKGFHESKLKQKLNNWATESSFDGLGMFENWNWRGQKIEKWLYQKPPPHTPKALNCKNFYFIFIRN